MSTSRMEATGNARDDAVGNRSRGQRDGGAPVRNGYQAPVRPSREASVSGRAGRQAPVPDYGTHRQRPLDLPPLEAPSRTERTSGAEAHAHRAASSHAQGMNGRDQGFDSLGHNPRPGDTRFTGTYPHDAYGYNGVRPVDAHASFGHAAHAAHAAQPYTAQPENPTPNAGSSSSGRFGGFFSAQPPTWFLNSRICKNGESPRRWQAFRVISSIVVVLLLVYLGGVIYFANHFYPASNIGNIDVSGMTVSQASSALQLESDNYALSVSGGAVSFTLSGKECGLSLDGDAIVKQAMGENNAWTWPVALLFPHDHTADLVSSVNAGGLSAKVKAEVDDYNAAATQPVNATVAYDAASAMFKIVSEVEGDALDYDKVLADVDAAVQKMQDSLALTSDDFQHPTVRSTDSTLKQAQKDAAKIVKTDLTFTVSSTTVATLGADIVATWIATDATGAMKLDDAALTTWSANLAKACTTVGTTRTWTREDGTACAVSGGVYGWDVDSEELLSDVKTAVSAGATQTIAVPMTDDADAFTTTGGRDWGAYIDVDISEQHARYYDASGNLLWEADFVSGIPDGTHDTPQGVYVINNKQSPSTLIGNATASGSPEYETKVSYWMPWVDNYVGFHDAYWQSAFGGTRYQDGYGSHGCINLSDASASSLYALISVGTVVVSHE